MTAPAAEPLPEFDKLWNYGDPAATEVKFRELLPQARASGDRSYLVQLLTQIARTHSLRGSFDQAHKLLDEAESLLTAELKVARVRYLLERGRSFNSAGKVSQAKPLFREAWSLGQTSGNDVHTADAGHMLAIVESGDAGLDWTRKTIAFVEASKDPRTKGWLGPLYNNSGWTLFERKDYTGALDCFRKSQKAFEDREAAEQVRVAKWSVAKALRTLGKLEDALAQQQAIQKGLDEQKREDGFVREELGECLLALGRESDAKPHFARAYELLSQEKWLVEEEPARIERLKKLGGK